MSIFKKLVLSFLVLLIAFLIFAPQKSFAIDYKINSKIKIDTDLDKAHDNAPTDTCYNGQVEIKVTGANGWSRNYSWSSQTDCLKDSLTKDRLVRMDSSGGTGLGKSFYNVKLIRPSNYDINYVRLYTLPTGPEFYITPSKSVDVPKGDKEVAFGLKPQSTTKTLTFSGYVFIDNGAGVNAGNGEKDGDEKCYKGQYTVQAQTPTPIVSKTVSGKEDCSGTYSLSKITTNEVSLRLYMPTGYTATKLNYKFNHLGDITDQVKSGASISLGNSSPVNFGIKPNISPTSTKTPDRCDCDRSGPCAQKCTNANNPVCKNPGLNSSTCVACTPEKKGACSNNQKCVNNKCVAKVTPTNTPKPTNPPGTTCDKNTPTLQVTPGNRNGNPGDEKTFDVKVINNDRGGACNPVTFVVSKEHLPSDRWTGKFDDNSLNNIPKAGGSKSTKFHVKSPANATTGVKPITLGVRRQSQTQAQVKTHITYTVGSSLSPTPTPTPTGTPTLTPTPDPDPEPGEITIDLEIGLDGIGTTSRIPLGGNKNPEEKDRALNFHLYKTADNSHTFSWQESVTYDETLEKFTALMSLPKPDKTDIADGNYNFYVSGEPFLTRRYTGSINLTADQTTTIKLEAFNLITGNITNSVESDNRIDQLDYHVLLSCSIYSQDEETCEKDPNYKENSDLNSDGIVNEDDFTLWLKETINQEGDSPPGEPTPTPSPSPSPSPTLTPTPRPSGTPSPTPTACNRVTPEMTITQDKTFVKPGGGKITYTVKIKNVDQGPCEDRNMNLTRDLRNENWIGVWDPNRTIVDFKKGQTRTKKLAVTSPNQAPVGTYKVKINLRNNSDVVVTKEVNFVIRNN